MYVLSIFRTKMSFNPRCDYDNKRSSYDISTWNSVSMRHSAFLVLLFATLAWGAQSNDAQKCPTYWVDATEVDMGCLWFNFKTSMAWESAQDYCRTLNITIPKEAHLVEIYSQEQQDFLELKFFEFEFVYGLQRNWWTGLTDDLFEGRWLWSFSLIQANFTNWYTSRPIEDTRYNYVYMDYAPAYGYTWVDQAGSSWKYYPICQFFPAWH